MTRPLRVGVQLPEVERVVRWPEYRAMARAAEEAGFDSIWIGDHLLYRGDGRPERGAVGRLDGHGGARRGDRARRDRAARGVPRVPSARTGRAHGGGDRRDQRRALRARRRLGLERAGVPRLRPAVRPPRQPRFIESFEIIRRLLAGERVTSEGRFWQVDDAVLLPPPARTTPIMTRHERAEAARRDAALRRQLEHVVRRLRQPRRGLRRPQRRDQRGRRARRARSRGGRAQRLRPRRARRARRASDRTPTTRLRSRAPRSRSPRPCATSPRPAPTRRSSCSTRSPRRASGSAPSVLAALDA